ncbi:hypothetical protein [Pelagicoccus sp. SDUM812005]|uniref:hypothetical protein n=1 Tax=Pelagicoccus sp. SDUM812005 TaxID=3041257 RepID=UPI002811597D|nr:hypothetical protein [Pelagicoccus sp. SDUM812005]
MVTTLLPLSYSSSNYKLSEEFDLDQRTTVAPNKIIELSNGSYLANGDFDLIDDQAAGGLALYTLQGQFKPFSKSLPLLNTQVNQAVLNSDGSYSITFTQGSPELGIDARSLVQFSSKGEILKITDLGELSGHILLENNRILAFRNEYDSRVPDSQYTQAQRYVLNSNGTFDLDNSFNAPRVKGDTRTIHPLPNGQYLLVGQYRNSETLKVGSFMKLDSNGQATSGFDPQGFYSEHLDYNPYALHALSNGDILILSDTIDGPSPFRLTAQGKIDTTFSTPNGLYIHSSSEIFLAPDNSYIVSGYSGQFGQTLPPIIKLQRDGNVDSSFELDKNGLFASTERGSITAIAATQQGLLVFGKMNTETESAGYAIISTDGTATATEAGRLESLAATSAHWTPSGELMTGTAIFRADGSRRTTFERDYNRKLTPLSNGTFVTSDFQFYDETISLLDRPNVPPNYWFAGEFPDGGFMARETNGKWGHDLAYVRLQKDGSVDTRFPRLSANLSILTISDEHIYYTEGSSGAEAQHVNRMDLHGVVDPTFEIKNLYGDLTRMRVTANGIYIPSVRIGEEKREKLLGARFELDGTLDETYAPETSIELSQDRKNLLVPPNTNVYARDGSSARLGSKPGEFSRETLFSISPSGEVTEVDSTLQWEGAQVDISATGDLYISGTALIGSGSIDANARYNKNAIGFSTPFLQKVSFSAAPLSIDITILDAEDIQLSWRKDGIVLAGENSSSLSFPSLTASDAGNYVLHAEAEGKIHTFGPITLLPPQSPTFTTHPSDREIVAGEDPVFEAGASALPAPKYQWYRDGIPIPGESFPRLSIDDAGLQSLGTYRLKATNELGSSWSQPALLTSPTEYSQRAVSLEITAKQQSHIFDILPSEQGGYLTKTTKSSDGFETVFKYHYIDASASDPILLPTPALPNGYDKLYICNRTGTKFAYTDFYPEGSLKVTRFVRLNTDYTIDDTFGAHTIEGRFLPLPTFQQWPDGTTWVDTGFQAVEISPSGETKELKRNEQFTGLYGANQFYGPLSLQLDDGTYTLMNLRDNYVSRIDADGAAAAENNRYYFGYSSSDEHLTAIWADGTVLYNLPDENKLIARTLGGDEKWTIDLTDWTVPYAEFFAAVGNDDTKRYLVAYKGDSFKETKTFWIQADGSHNFNTPSSFTGLLAYSSIHALPSEQVVLLGKTRDGSNQSGAVLVNPDGTLVATTTLTDFVPAQPSFVRSNRDGNALFIAHPGTHVNGYETGPIAKMNADGTLDTAFKTDLEDLNGHSLIDIIALDGDYLAALTKFNYVYTVHLLDSSGSFVVRWEIDNLTGRVPLVFRHEGEKPGLLTIASRPSTTRVSRYLLDGSIDPTFKSGTLPHIAWFTSAAVGPEGNIYILQEQPNRLFKLNADGSADDSFAFDPNAEPLRNITTDRTGKILAQTADSLTIQRFNPDGSRDTTFRSDSHPRFHTRFIRTLPNGRILAERLIFTETGEIDTSTGIRFDDSLGASFGNRFANTSFDFDSKKSSVRIYSFEGPPAVTRQPRNLVAEIGSTTTLAIDVDNPKMRYLWKRNGEQIPDENGNRLVLSPLSQLHAGTYSVTMIWDEGELELPSFTVSTKNPSTQILEAPKLEAQATPSTLECSWTPNERTSFELFYSEDLIYWEVAPITTRNSTEKKTTSIPLTPQSSKVFVRLHPAGNFQ